MKEKRKHRFVENDNTKNVVIISATSEHEARNLMKEKSDGKTFIYQGLVSGAHDDITYSTRENGDVSSLQFHSDEGREKFRQFQILNVLKMEVMNTMGIRFYRGSIVNVLRRYFPDIPRTRKGAYKYLVKRGYYDHPAFEDKR